jgi:hypothetical protein
MADTKISALTSATVPLAGTEVLPIVQGGQTRKVPVSDLTAGRAIAASAATITGATTAVSLTLANSGGGTNATFAVTENTGVTLNLNEGATARQLIIQQGGVETWRFNASGNFAAADGKGIDFSATSGTGTSELLDDYEEGTWTVSFFDAASGGNASATTTTGYYTKVGNCVTAVFSVSNISTAGMTGGNAFYFTLPFTSATTIGIGTGASVLEQFTFPALRTMVAPYISDNSARGFFRASGSAVDTSSILVSELSTGVSDIERCAVTYFA